MTNHTPLRSLALLSLGLAIAASSHAATTILWNSGGNGGGSKNSWNVAANWNGGVLPGATDTAQFGAATAHDTDITVNTSTSVGTIQFTNANVAHTILPAAAQTLTLGNITGIDNLDTTAAQAIQTGLILNNASGVAFSNAGTLTVSGAVANGGFLLTLSGAGTGGTVSGVISGTGGLTKSGNGTWTLSAANTYTGLTTVSAGTLNVTGSLPTTAKLQVDGGTITFTPSPTIAELSGAGGTVAFTAGAHTLTIAQASNTSYAGAINGTSVALTKSGAGTLTLTGSSGYTGATTISAGTLKVDGALTGTSGTAINTGGTLAGSGSISSGTTTLNSGGFISPANGTIGNLSLAALTFNGGGTLNLGLGAGGASDTLTIAGAFTKGTVGQYSIDFGGGGEANTTYTLASFGGVTNFVGADFTGVNSAFQGNFAIVGNQLQFTTTAIPEPSTYAAILGVGALGFVIYRRRQARAAAVAVTAAV